MSIALPGSLPAQRPLLALAGIAATALFVQIWSESPTRAWVLLIGIALGIALYHAAFGFTAAYRRAIVDRDLSCIAAQAVMLILAMVLFAPVLAAGEVFGHAAGGAVAPVSVAMLTGAFVFGIGMHLGGACASGTLFTVGGGNSRMMVTLAFFCLGSWWGTLDLAWWRALPGLGPVSLGQEFGYGTAVILQTGFLFLVLWGLHRLGARFRQPLGWRTAPGLHRLRLEHRHSAWCAGRRGHRRADDGIRRPPRLWLQHRRVLFRRRLEEPARMGLDRHGVARLGHRHPPASALPSGWHTGERRVGTLTLYTNAPSLVRPFTAFPACLLEGS